MLPIPVLLLPPFEPQARQCAKGLRLGRPRNLRLSENINTINDIVGVSDGKNSGFGFIGHC
jgi:hypothetical protein